MRIKSIFVFLFVVVLLSVISCKKQLSPEPPVSTSTVTVTISLPAADTATVVLTVTPQNSVTLTDTASPTTTLTITPTEFSTAWSSVTGTNTMTVTVTPTATKTVMPSILIVDNFEDQNYVNNLPGYNTWACGSWGGGGSNYSITGAESGHGSYAFASTGTAKAANGSSPHYQGYYSVSTWLDEAQVTGIDITSYVFLDFRHIAKTLTTASGTVTYKVKIVALGGNTVETNFTLNSSWTTVLIPLSSFALPSGWTGYTPAEVFSKAIIIYWEIYIDSPVLNDSTQVEMYFDDVVFLQ